MKEKGILLLFLCFSLILKNPGIEAQEIYRLDLETAIYQAVRENRELDLVRREESLIQQRLTQEKQSFQIRLSSTPQITIQGGEVFPTFSPGMQATAEKGVWGGTLSGELTTSVDLLQDGQVEARISVSFRRPLIKKKERPEPPDHYQQAKEDLVERVFNSYYQLLIKEEKIALQKEELALAALRMEASQFWEQEEEKARVFEAYRKEEETLIKQKETLLELKTAFRRLLHLQEGVEFTLTEEISELQEVESLQYWLTEAQKNHPGIIQAKEKLWAADYHSGPFTDSGWEVDLITGLDPYPLSPWPHDPSFFIRLNANRTFTSRDSLQQQEEELQQDIAALELERTLEKVTKDVGQGFLQLQETLEQIQLLKEEGDKAQKDFALLERKYSLGLIGPIALEEGRLQIHRQKYTLLAAIQGAWLQYLQLQRRCGLSIVPEGVVIP